MEESTNREKIVNVLKEKTVLKRSVFENTKVVFSELKEVIKEIAESLQSSVGDIDPPLHISVTERGQYEIRLTIAGDTLVFMMHSNVFDFEKSHKIHRTSYVKKASGKSYCGMINVYNFLSDSFKYKRVNDLGYLVGRIFINQDLHFFVEGKKQMGFLFNDFQHSKLGKSQMEDVVENIIKYCLSFDLLTPPYDQVSYVTVDEMDARSSIMKLRTGKRLGFKFMSEEKIS